MIVSTHSALLWFLSSCMVVWAMLPFLASISKSLVVVKKKDDLCSVWAMPITDRGNWRSGRGGPREPARDSS